MNWKFWNRKDKLISKSVEQVERLLNIGKFRTNEEIKKSLEKLQPHEKNKYELEIKLAELQINEITKAKTARGWGFFWGVIAAIVSGISGVLLSNYQAQGQSEIELKILVNQDTAFALKCPKDTSLVRLVKLAQPTKTIQTKNP